jgi:predicted HicB family RNase H-like nuclease
MRYASIVMPNAKAKKVGRPRKINDPRALSVRLPGDLYDRLVRVVEKNQTSLNDAVLEAVASWVKEQGPVRGRRR